MVTLVMQKLGDQKSMGQMQRVEAPAVPMKGVQMSVAQDADVDADTVASMVEH